MITRYTNVVLTIIALALVTIAAQNLAAPVSAQSGVQKVAICEQGDASRCVSLSQQNAPFPNYLL
jgi:hypothetical protein